MRHRKKVKHYEEVRAVHELTFSCYQRRPLLKNNEWLRLLSESISRATKNHHFNLLAFVFMPEHVHLLVLPTNINSRVSALLKAIKKPFSFRVKKRMIETGNPLLNDLTLQQRPGITTFRFWQEGPGYDRNLDSKEAIESAIHYIHTNPVRRDLCEKAVDWKWSSARFYLQPMGENDTSLPRIDGLSPELFD